MDAADRGSRQLTEPMNPADEILSGEWGRIPISEWLQRERRRVARSRLYSAVTVERVENNRLALFGWYWQHDDR